MNVHPTTVYVDSATNVELRAPKSGRKFLEIVNASDDDIYFAEDTMATAENGVTIAAGASHRTAYDASGAGVPQGSLWLLGKKAAGTLQRVLVREA